MLRNATLPNTFCGCVGLSPKPAGMPLWASDKMQCWIRLKPGCHGWNTLAGANLPVYGRLAAIVTDSSF